jgi:hypothetical protein
MKWTVENMIGFGLPVAREVRINLYAHLASVLLVLLALWFCYLCNAYGILNGASAELLVMSVSLLMMAASFGIILVFPAVAISFLIDRKAGSLRAFLLQVCLSMAFALFALSWVQNFCT